MGTGASAASGDAQAAPVAACHIVSIHAPDPGQEMMGAPARPPLPPSGRGAGDTPTLMVGVRGVDEWDRGIRDVLRHTDVFFANDDELRGITHEADAAHAGDVTSQRRPPSLCVSG